MLAVVERAADLSRPIQYWEDEATNAENQELYRKTGLLPAQEPPAR